MSRRSGPVSKLSPAKRRSEKHLAPLPIPDIRGAKSGRDGSPSTRVFRSRAIAVVAILSTLAFIGVYALLPPVNQPDGSDGNTLSTQDSAHRHVSRASDSAPNSALPSEPSPGRIDNSAKSLAAARTAPESTPKEITAGLALPIEPIDIDTETQQKELLAAVEAAVAEFPNGADVLHVAGLTYGELLQTDRAAELFRQSIEIDGRNADVLVAYADMLTKSGKQPEAIAALEKSLAAGLDSAAIRASLGNAYIQIGELPQAAKSLEDGRRQFPDSPAVRLASAQAQLQIEQFAEAEQNARKAIELGEKSRAAYVALSAALVRLGKREEAVALRSEMPALEQTTTDDERYQESFREFASHTYGLLGLAYHNRGREKQANQWLRRSLDFNPSSPKSLAAMADIAFRESRLSDALPIYLRLLNCDPQNLVNYSNCFNIALTLNDVATAEEVLRRATKVDLSGYADLYLAQFLLKMEKLSEASQFAKTATERSADVEAYLVLIAIQQKQGKAALAFETLRQALEVAPNDPRLLNLAL